MHTWALVCQLALTPAQCNLETAARWFEVAPNKPIDINAAIKRLGLFDPTTQFIKIMKYGGSLGTDSYIYYPCDSPDNIANNLKDASQYVRDQQSKGGCLGIIDSLETPAKAAEEAPTSSAMPAKAAEEAPLPELLTIAYADCERVDFLRAASTFPLDLKQLAAIEMIATKLNQTDHNTPEKKRELCQSALRVIEQRHAFEVMAWDTLETQLVWSEFIVSALRLGL